MVFPGFGEYLPFAGDSYVSSVLGRWGGVTDFAQVLALGIVSCITIQLSDGFACCWIVSFKTPSFALEAVVFLFLILRSLDMHKNNISDCAIVA